MNYINGFSVITVTNRRNKIENIIQNFQAQLFDNKELIIVINKDDILIDEYRDYINENSRISIFKLPQGVNLGSCLNFAVDKSKYNYIAKFDDDDYYSKYYLNEMHQGFIDSGCKIVGKFKVYYYLEEINSLCEVVAKSDNFENELTHMLKGSAICFDKEIFNTVKFANRNLAEDSMFCKACIEHGFNIYATSRYNHIVYRDKVIKNHTWKESTQFFLNLSKIVYSNVTFNECKELVEFKY